MERMPVDIIVPVYNGYEDLCLCIESVLRHTDFSIDRVLFVNDCSPDERILPLLKEYIRPGIELIDAPVNGGFSESVNLGMKASRHDVILLNSDTIVTKRWVDKLFAAAYADPATGTVTPFSNNGSLCSTPVFFQDNTVPEGFSVDEYAAIVEYCSPREYPQIPVAVGFCMFLKREAIDAVGLFDAATFQRGYGEENDFCFRAARLGYRHVLCDDTFIFHSGTVSFSDGERKALGEAHQKILQERYLPQVLQTAGYLQKNPHQYLRDNIELFTMLENGKKNILYLLHADFRIDAEDHVGGTQFHVKDLTQSLKKSHNIFVAARDGAFLHVTVYAGKVERYMRFSIGPRPEFPVFRNKAIADILENLITSFSIDLVHVQHVFNLSLDIFYIAHARKIPLAVTLHDYYYICPTIKMTDPSDHFCGCKEECAECLPQQFPFTEYTDYIANWRRQCGKALSLCDRLITPSESAKGLYTRFYPELAERITVISHGMDLPSEAADLKNAPVCPDVELTIDNAFVSGREINGWARLKGCNGKELGFALLVQDDLGNSQIYNLEQSPRADVAFILQDNSYLWSGFSIILPDKPFQTEDITVRMVVEKNETLYVGEKITLRSKSMPKPKACHRIAFLGGLNPAKGSRTAKAIMDILADKFEWYIIGGIGDVELHKVNRKNIHKSGWYHQKNVKTFLAGQQIDLVCILPTWPETFCYTVSESLLSGIPILATDIGAVGERLRDSGLGWLVSPEMSAEAIAKKIEEIFQDSENYRQVVSNVAAFKHKTIEEMSGEYAHLYELLFPSRQDQHEILDIDMLLKGQMLGKSNHSSVLDESVQNSHSADLERQLRAIQSSTAYRVANFISKRNFPLKKHLKKLILRKKG